MPIRKRIIKKYLKVLLPPETPLPPLTYVGTGELEKMKQRMESFMSYGDDPPDFRLQTMDLLRQEVDEILRDHRFRGYPWHVDHHVTLYNELRRRSGQALCTIDGILKGRQYVFKLRKVDPSFLQV